MPSIQQLVSDNLDIWTSAIQKKSLAGRGGNNGKLSLYGIKKLRELILELAVRGKLVPQDPNDEPASVLLKKIAAEKERLVKAGKVKNQKMLAEIGDDSEKPYELPKGWIWLMLTDLYYPISPSGKKLKSSQILETGKFPVVDQGKSYIAGFTDDADLLIKIPGPVVVFGDHTTERKYIDFHFVAGADGTKILRPYMMYEKYFYNYLLSYKLENRGYARHFKVLNSHLMALPPLKEQHRIVAKVDELMALCDQLEQQTEGSITAHQTLVETLLGTLIQSQSAEELSQNWTRIAEHFDTLFTTEHSIDLLKQTVLQLAVRGKLVPQDPNDEPASALLKKIAAEKEKLTKEGKIRKQKPLPRISEKEKHYELPQGWEWSRFGDIIFNRDAERIPLSVENRRKRQGEFDYYGASGVIDSIDDYLFEKPLLLIGEDGANLINRSTPIAFIAYGKYWVNNHAHVLDGISLNFLNYLCLHINAISLESYVTGTAQPKMNQAKMNTILIALPPISEQHRIVTKVDELMALCDQLKSSLNDAQSTQMHLADAVIDQAVVN